MATRKKKVRTTGGAPFCKVLVRCSRCGETGFTEPRRVKGEGQGFGCAPCRHQRAGAF